MTDDELREMALRAVAADLQRLLFDRPDITARVSSGAEARFVHNIIRSAVEHLQDEFVTYCGDEGVYLGEEA